MNSETNIQTLALNVCIIPLRMKRLVVIAKQVHTEQFHPKL